MEICSVKVFQTDLVMMAGGQQVVVSPLFCLNVTRVRCVWCRFALVAAPT